MTFAGRLLALREGRMSFADFYAATRSLWGYMAARLLRARNPGIGVGEEDVAQELVLECWRCVGRWDPSRGPTIDGYVLFNSCARAKKWLDAQREVCQGSALAKNPTRAPRLGSADTVEREAWAASRSCGARSGEDELDRRRVVLPKGLTRVERVVVRALIETRDGNAAALLIYGHYPTRLALELGSEQAAARLVRRVAARLCDEPALFNQLED